MADKWRECELGDVINLKRGYDLPSTKREEGTIPIVTSSGMGSTHSTAKVKGPGVVTGRYGTIGQVYFVTEDFWPLNTTLYVEDFKGNDPKYVSYLLSTINFQAYSDKAAVPGLNRNHLHLAKVLLAPPTEQRRIAHILGTLDDKIELNRRQNETLESIARALFKSWFVDFDPVRAKTSGETDAAICQRLGLSPQVLALFPAALEDSAVGEVPTKWEVNDLGSHLEVLETGRRPKGGVSSFSEGIPSVGAESIVGIGKFDFQKTKYVPSTFFEKMKSGLVESEDVLLYKDGGKPGDFRPRVSMFGYGFPFDTFAINEHVFRLRSIKLGQPFLYLQIGDERVLHELRHRGAKAAIPGINQGDVKTLKIVTPPNELLAVFNKAAGEIFKKILANSANGQQLAALRDELLPRLLSGELSAVAVTEEVYG